MNAHPAKLTRGFTLIELLAAMTILTIMVLLISRIFADATKVWQVGTKRVESNTDGRAAVDFMMRELSAALCDGTNGPLALVANSGSTDVLGMQPDKIFFVTSDRSPTNTGRQVMQVVYEWDEMRDRSSAKIANRYRVVRYMSNNPSKGEFNCYKGGFPRGQPTLEGPPQTLADNIRTLEFWVYDMNGVQHKDYDSTKYGPPGWVEVYLEILGKDNAIKAAVMGAGAKSFCDRNVRRYVGRAYLHSNGGRS